MGVVAVSGALCLLGPAGPAWANCGLAGAYAASRPGGFWERQDGAWKQSLRKTRKAASENLNHRPDFFFFSNAPVCHLDLIYV